MISLRKHIEAHGEEFAKSTLSAFQAALDSTAQACMQAVPQVGAGLSRKLSGLHENLSIHSAPEDVTQAQQEAERELTAWAESAAQYSQEKTNEVKEIMVAVATAAVAGGERDQRYSTQFNGLTTRMHSIAKLEDLTRVRRSVLEIAAELKTAAKKMAEEGEKSITQLRAEVATYRTRLAQSEERESIDPLTGLANRREIDSLIEERIRWRQEFCLVILDLNGFKKINDTYGHVAGDDLLRQFAAELKTRVRSNDPIGRWGGDEFVVVFDTNLHEARIRMDRIREWVFGDYEINNGREIVQVNLRASIGIAEWDKKESAIELLARADERMYAEKKLVSMPQSVVA